MKKKEHLVCNQVLDSLDGKHITRGVHIEVTSTWTVLCWELNVHIHNFPKNLIVTGNMYKADVMKTVTRPSMINELSRVVYEAYPNTIKKLTPKQKEQYLKKAIPPKPKGLPILSGRSWII